MGSYLLIFSTLTNSSGLALRRIPDAGSHRVNEGNGRPFVRHVNSNWHHLGVEINT
jgi:hypothetical protein